MSPIRIDILTLFPGMFCSMEHSLTEKARERGLFELHLHDLRTFSDDRSSQVDDTPYGGGAGMVIMAPPVLRAMEHVRNVGHSGEKPHTILTSPQGKRLTHSLLRELAGKEWIVFLCGRYEGFDERITDLGLVDEEISLGDYVLGGGELPAMVVIEGLLRLVPGVVGNSDSVEEDSFSNGLLDYPHYTRPEEFMGLEVPEVLLSGHSKNIALWRRKQSLKRTLEKRPDLLDSADLSDEDLMLLDVLRRKNTT